MSEFLLGGVLFFVQFRAPRGRNLRKVDYTPKRYVCLVPATITHHMLDASYVMGLGRFVYCTPNGTCSGCAVMSCFCGHLFTRTMTWFTMLAVIFFSFMTGTFLTHIAFYIEKYWKKSVDWFISPPE